MPLGPKMTSSQRHDVALELGDLYKLKAPATPEDGTRRFRLGNFYGAYDEVFGARGHELGDWVLAKEAGGSEPRLMHAPDLELADADGDAVDLCKLAADLQRAARYFRHAPEKFDIGNLFECVGTFDCGTPGLARNFGQTDTPAEKLVREGRLEIRELRCGLEGKAPRAFSHSLPEDAPPELPRLDQSYYSIVAHFDPGFVPRVPEPFVTDAMRAAHAAHVEAEAAKQRAREEAEAAKQREREEAIRAFDAKYGDLQGFSAGLWARLMNRDSMKAWIAESNGGAAGGRGAICAFLARIEPLVHDVDDLRTVFRGANGIPPAVIEAVLQFRHPVDRANVLHTLAVQHIDVVFDELPALAVALLMAHNEHTGSVVVSNPLNFWTGVCNVARCQLKATWLKTHRSACTTRAAVDHLLAEITETELPRPFGTLTTPAVRRDRSLQLLKAMDPRKLLEMDVCETLTELVGRLSRLPKPPKQQLKSLEALLRRINHPSNLDFDVEAQSMEDEMAEPVFSSGPLGKRARA